MAGGRYFPDTLWYRNRGLDGWKSGSNFGVVLRVVVVVVVVVVVGVVVSGVMVIKVASWKKERKGL